MEAPPREAGQPVLSLTAISKAYRNGRARVVLRDISLTLTSGEYVAVMGESGVGKSTLLNLIAGLDRADGGRIVFAGQDLAELDDDAMTALRRSAMGFVFQAFHVLPHLSVEQNVALPLLLNGVGRAESAARVAAMLAAVGLAGFGASRPSELSGGELQRVAIARALIHHPPLVLADEPTGNLDPETAAQVLRLLRDRIKAVGAAGILVTHSALAAATADRTLLLTSKGLAPHAPASPIGV
ncbi:ABC transporter ATP-binding protein [Crenobacter sp. SG2303]|uniref:ABC transporter ATP-binding protein n=1 Tax=Crenobacter oryzisoli TaxID=3056844 RepID=A0ABT7XUD7_9NEIS|nr:ABC transporter ATP-binding protein [Crenobacter sp. SG2303]MDN0077412.1 ABC transporter ATP-binding protein [Crenobacter sp. SG2303]